MKFDVMSLVIMQKFSNTDLKQLLLGTGSRYLEETNDWGDKFWGVCDGEGLNNLGRILMAARQFYSLREAGVIKSLF